MCEIGFWVIFVCFELWVLMSEFEQMGFEYMILFFQHGDSRIRLCEFITEPGH